MRCLLASLALNAAMCVLLVGMSANSHLGATIGSQQTTAFQGRQIRTTPSHVAGRRHALPRDVMAKSSCEQQEISVNRRNILGGGLMSGLSALAGPSFAKIAVKGFQEHKDTSDKYQFLYPFGWEEIYVKGTDILYKDIIEPLETASVTVIQTEKTNIKEYGDLADVSTSLAEKVLTAPGQDVKIVKAAEKDVEGHTYFVFEFTAKNQRYTRHTLVSAVIDNGKYYIFVTGANQKRWGTMSDKLTKVVDSFKLI
eukprot:CAMPEP_0197536426 /NCGR_PEP_ID=MMETSP1318-20131121/53834_1 /TAXON_ID=552666 /ORGANISM="Partenskyella glossopodia, Strain RCC365" /LENGTH=253 /DNA_ID=CAMNT_0043094313 /DNA_START=52 /DNA_END=813 /DNA_ORIENTATION=+